MAVGQLAVDQLDLDRPGHGHRVEVGGEHDGHAVAGRRGRSGPRCCRTRAGARRGAVLVRPRRRGRAARPARPPPRPPRPARARGSRTGAPSAGPPPAARRRSSRAHPPSGACSRAEPRGGARACSAAAPMNSRNSGCGRVGPALELGVELRGAEPRVVRQLDDLDQPPVGRAAADHEPGRLDVVAQRGVDLVAVAVALVDDGLVVVGRARPGALGTRCTGSAPRRMVPPRSSMAALLGQEVDDRVGRLGVELAGVGAVHPAARGARTR